MKQLKNALLMLTLGSPGIASASGIDKIVKDPTTLAFILLILGVTIFFLIKFDRYAVNHGPEILTTLGIFGCFSGIAFALLDFDTTNITDSVPKLLDGVKTAFWASVTGVLGALTLKFKHRFTKQPIQVTEGEPKSASLEDVVVSINTLRKSIAGENDTSLISQIRLMRQEQNDNSKAMVESLDKFAEKISKLGTAALIDALKEVIRDFNKNLTEQFGENFKQLNSAVERLVTWQQQYKEELDQLQLVQKQSASDLSKVAEIFTSLAEKAQIYTESANALKTLLSQFESQYQILKSSQEALSSVLLEMKTVEPTFSQKIIDLTEVFKTGTISISSEVQNQIKELSNQLRTKNEEMADVVKKMVPEIQNQINTQIIGSQNKLESNFEQLNKNLEIELQNSLKTLGQQLASLSEKFVSDYGPLTDRLRDIVRISKGV